MHKSKEKKKKKRTDLFEMEVPYSAYMLEFEQFVLRFLLNVNHWVKTIETYDSTLFL